MTRVTISSPAAAAILLLLPGCDYSSSVELRCAQQGELVNAEPFGVSVADDSINPLVRIVSPLEGENIYDDFHDDMSWEANDVPKDQRFVVFASDNFNHYLMYPFPRSGRTPGSYLDKYIRPATESDGWELSACLWRTAVRYFALEPTAVEGLEPVVPLY